MEEFRQGIPILFKCCQNCGINFEYVDAFYEFTEDVECVFCSMGDPIPEHFVGLEYVTLEDLQQTPSPRRIQECFSKIDDESAVKRETPPEPEIPMTDRRKKKRIKKEYKDKKDS